MKFTVSKCSNIINPPAGLSISFIPIINKGDEVKPRGYLNDFCISETRKLHRLNSKLLVIPGYNAFDSLTMKLLSFICKAKFRNIKYYH